MNQESYKLHLSRLERLFRTFIRGKYRSADDIWRLQLDLLELQQAIQADVSLLKELGRPDHDNELEGLRWARKQARRFGDAFAWIILQNKRRAVYPLARNSPVPVPERGPSTEGVIKLSEVMAAEGWGFPLLHDVTDLLRIGDITFVNYREKVLHTVEVKGRLIGSTDSDTEYEVTAHFYQRPAFNAPSLRLVQSRERRQPARLGRQLKRIQVAKEHGLAPSGQVSQVSDGPLLSIDIDTGSSKKHWTYVAAVCRSARRSGYAFRVVESTFFYMAVYKQEGLDEKALLPPRLYADLRESSILGCSKADDSLFLMGVPTHHSRTDAETWLPYFLYPLPKTTIADLLHGRMSILTMVNVGRVVEALRAADITVEQIPTEENTIHISRMVQHPAGQKYVIEYRHLEQALPEALMESWPLEYLVNYSKQALDAAERNLLTGSIDLPS